MSAKSKVYNALFQHNWLITDEVAIKKIIEIPYNSFIYKINPSIKCCVFQIKQSLDIDKWRLVLLTAMKFPPIPTEKRRTWTSADRTDRVKITSNSARPSSCPVVLRTQLVMYEHNTSIVNSAGNFN